MTIVHSSEISTDPKDSVRSDLWNTMTVVELCSQQELLMIHATRILTMMDASGTSHTVSHMYEGVQQAMAALERLIENKSKGNFNA